LQHCPSFALTVHSLFVRAHPVIASVAVVPGQSAPAVFCCGVARYSGVRSALLCTCGYEFCFMCLKGAHRPSACWEWGEWERACSENVDLASVKFMMDNFKKCPQVGVAGVVGD
jgi:hypothetical protein